MKLIDLKEVSDADKGILDALENMKSRSDSLDAIMIVALDKDGRQILETSNTSGFKKAFMVQFLNAWLNKWFDVADL